MAVVNEVSTVSHIPQFVPFGLLYYTQDTGDLYIGTGFSTGSDYVGGNPGPNVNVELISSPGGLPGGFNGDIQYNNNGNLGGSAATITAAGAINALSITATSATIGALTATAENIVTSTITSAFITTATVTSTLELQTATIVDSLGSTGTVGQALESTGTGVKWAAVSSTETWAALTGAMTATQVAPWYNATSTIDSGVSRLGAASLAIGNGTAGDTTGTLTVKHLNVIDATSDNALSLVGTDNGTNLLSFNLTSAPTTSVVAAYLHTNGLAWYTTSESFAILSNSHGVGVISTGVYGWGSGIPSAGLDTGISRLGAASLAIGNGTATSTAGSLVMTTATVSSTLYGGVYWSGGVVGLTSASEVPADITLNGGLVTAVTVCDEEFKDDIQPFDKGLSAILGVQPKSWLWKDKHTATRFHGFTAQDVRKTIPEATPARENGSLQFHRDAVLAVAVNAIQELHALIKAQDARIAALEAKS